MKFWIAFVISIAYLTTQAQIVVNGSNNNKTFSVKNGQDVVISGSNNDIVIYGSPHTITVTGANHNICVSGRVETLTIKGANADVWVGTLNKVVFNNSSTNNNVHWAMATNSRRAPLLNDAGTNNDFNKANSKKCIGNDRVENTEDENMEENENRGGGTSPVVINIPPVVINPNPNIKKWRIKKQKPAQQDTVPKRGDPVIIDPGTGKTVEE